MRLFSCRRKYLLIDTQSGFNLLHTIGSHLMGSSRAPKLTKFSLIIKIIFSVYHIIRLDKNTTNFPSFLWYWMRTNIRKHNPKFNLFYWTGVNFINIIRTNFSYERRFSSYVLALLKISYEKRMRATLMKLTTGQNFLSYFQMERKRMKLMRMEEGNLRKTKWLGKKTLHLKSY